MKLTVKWTSKFKKDYKLCINRGLDISLIDEVIALLSEKQKLPPKYKDHQLVGNWKDFRECHIKSDWILVYKIDRNFLILTVARTGTHSDILF